MTLGACGSTAKSTTTRTSTRAQGEPELGQAFAHIVGFGSVRPKEISFGGDPTSVVSNINWASWGGREAVGAGTSDWVWPGTCVGCNRSSSARVVAFDLGTCKGRPAYLAEEWYFPEYGEQFDPKRGLKLCTSETTPTSLAGVEAVEPTKCPPVAIADGFEGTEVDAVGLSCSAASAIVAHVPTGPYLKERRFKVGTYRCGTMGSMGGPPSIECELDYRSVLFTLTAE
jgi:hypothetical protein